MTGAAQFDRLLADRRPARARSRVERDAGATYGQRARAAGRDLHVFSLGDDLELTGAAPLARLTYPTQKWRSRESLEDPDERASRRGAERPKGAPR